MESRTPFSSLRFADAYDDLVLMQQVDPADLDFRSIDPEVPLSEFVFPTSRGPEPWQHTSHVFGFLQPPNASGDRPVRDVGQESADALSGVQIDLRLDRLRIAKYPGRGVNRVLFEFAVLASDTQNSASSSSLVFAQNYRVAEGQSAAVRGFQIFNGISVPRAGLAFKFKTVNVVNEADKAMLEVLDSPEVQGGLNLLGGLNPIIPVVSQYAQGFARRTLKSKENKEISEVNLGLDFSSGSGTGAALKVGSYVVIQAPTNPVWDWSSVVVDGNSGVLINSSTRQEIALNYFIFRVGLTATP